MIIYGLGNNEKKYFDTRHNVGRLIAEGLAKGDFTSKKSFSYFKTPQEYLLFSNGYMNESGLPLVGFLGYFKPPLQTILIIHDDSDQEEGSIKLVQGGGSGGHHGINSIYKHILGSQFGIEHIWRLKIGIRPKGNTKKSETFVLSPNSKELSEVISRTIVELQKPNLDQNLQKLQNSLNTKPAH
jgi:peptidyl-tRNA hydrolase, PTH1 family